MVENEIVELEEQQEEELMFSDDIEIRKLKFPEMAICMSILSKIGLNQFYHLLQNKEFLKVVNAFTQNDDGEEKEVSVVGIAYALEIATIIMGNIQKVENDLYQFLANLTNKKVQEIKNLDGEIVLDLICRVITLPQFKDFLKVALRRFRSAK